MNNWSKKVQSYLKEAAGKKIVSSGSEALKEMAEHFVRLAGGAERAIELIRKYSASASSPAPAKKQPWNSGDKSYGDDY